MQNISEAIQGWIEGYRDTSNLVDPINLILMELADKQFDFKGLFEMMQKYFISPDDVVRERSSKLIRTVLQRMPDLIPQLNQLQAILLFFISRFRDVSSTIETTGIVQILFQRAVLAKYNYSSLEEPIRMFVTQIFKDQFYPKAFGWQVKNSIFITMRIFIENYSQDVAKNGAEFLSVVLTHADQESDPRNMLEVFRIMKIILQEFPLEVVEQFLEQIYQLLDMYYPIEFKPPKNDKIGITTQMMVDSLDDCFVNPRILSKTISSIEEKLTSKYEEGQILSLGTVSKVFTTNQYGSIPSQLIERFINILDRLLEHQIEQELEEPYIQAVISILNYLNQKGILKSFNSQELIQIDQVLNKLNQEINDKPQTVNANLALKCLLRAQNINNQMTIKILIQTMKTFIGSINYTDTEISGKKIQVLFRVLQQTNKIFTENDSFNQSQLQEKVLMTLNEGLFTQQENIKILAMRAVMELFKLNKQNNQMFEQFNQSVFQILQKEDNITLKKCCLDYFDSVEGNSLQLQNYFNQLESSQDSELRAYSYPAQFKLFPQVYEQKKSIILSDSSLVLSVLKFIDTIHINQLAAEYNYYLHLFTSQVIQEKDKKACIQIIKQLVRRLDQNNLQAVYEAHTGNIEELLSKPGQIPFYLPVLDALTVDKRQQVHEKIISDLLKCEFSTEQEFNLNNTKQTRKVLKRTFKNPLILDKWLQIITRIDESYNLYSTLGVSKFTIDCLAIKQGLVDENVVAEKFIQEVISRQQLIDDAHNNFFLNVIDGGQNLKYSMKVIENIILPLRSIASPDLISNLLSRCDSDAMRLYDQYWAYFIEVIQKSTFNELLIQIIFNISEYSEGKVNVIPILLDILENKDPQFQLISMILKKIGDNNQLGLIDVQLQPQVIKMYRKYLDHPKRLVRKSAQYGINRWYLIGGKGI